MDIRIFLQNIFEYILVVAVIHDSLTIAKTSDQNPGRWRRSWHRRRRPTIPSSLPLPPPPPRRPSSSPRQQVRQLRAQLRNLRSLSTANCVPVSLACDPRSKYRTPDGTCNNLQSPTWGAAGWPFKRILAPDYDDGKMSPRAHDTVKRPLPSPRTVSRQVHTADSPLVQSGKLTSMFTHFGQFLDHDIDLTPLSDSSSDLDCCDETITFPSRGFYSIPKIRMMSGPAALSRPLPGTCYPIEVVQPDGHFNTNCMNFVRSKAFAPTLKCTSATREQGNAVTSFIDASQVYGSSLGQQNNLRSFTRGTLKSYQDNLLPANDNVTCVSSGILGKVCFAAGDQRVNEQPLLSTLHVVFHRYHNMIAEFLASRHTRWDDEIVFQESKKIVGAVMQNIVYNEYLPPLLGRSHMTAFGLRSGFSHRYEPSTDPRIANEFAAAAFRFGHSMVPGQIKLGASKYKLENWFFCPHAIQDMRKSNLNELVKGALTDLSQGSDRFFAPAVTEKLFENRGHSLDLVSLNIQRGRDHGVPGYNAFRKACGLPALDFRDVNGNPFEGLFRSMDDVDLFSGAMTESHVDGGVVGPTFACLIARQFRDIKYGDRFWFENTNFHTGFNRGQLNAIKKTTMASILCSVTGIGKAQRSVFESISQSRNPELPCDRIGSLDLTKWLDRRYY